MTRSIKSLLNQLSPILGMSPGAIYERQRALVRLGALHATPGKGPGSGVELSSENLATLLIGCAAFTSLASIDKRIFGYIRARSSARTCEMTGSKTFGGAIQAILEEKFSKSHPYPNQTTICFNLQAPAGYIHWLDQPVHWKDGTTTTQALTSYFGVEKEPDEQAGIYFQSYVSRRVLLRLKDLITAYGAPPVVAQEARRR